MFGLEGKEQWLKIKDSVGSGSMKGGVNITLLNLCHAQLFWVVGVEADPTVLFPFILTSHHLKSFFLEANETKISNVNTINTTNKTTKIVLEAKLK